jgi:hypothetical protein
MADVKRFPGVKLCILARGNLATVLARWPITVFLDTTSATQSWVYVRLAVFKDHTDIVPHKFTVSEYTISLYSRASAPYQGIVIPRTRGEYECQM